jgi:hypothetical protein
MVQKVAKDNGRWSIKQLVIRVAIGIVVVLAILYVIGSSSNNLGVISKPYNASLGYQGTGYYNYNGAKFYASNISQFNNRLSTTSLSTSSVATTTQTTYPTTSVIPTIITTIPTTDYTTSILYTMTYYTTSIPYQYTTIIPTSSHGISNGNFTFTFTLLNRTQDTWSFPITTYNQYVAAPRISPDLVFNVTGKLYTYPDYRGLVTPSFFSKIVQPLTNGKTAAQFVNEVVNIKNQLTVYSLVFQNTSVYPAEVLGSGEGDCKDFGVLIASILEAGNQEAGYGMQIQFVYVNSTNLTAGLKPDHLILYITFANGTTRWVDTTNVLPQSSYLYIKGYYEPLNCNATSCQTATLCNGAYCDAVYYYSSENYYTYCKTSGYVVGADNNCHLECGTDSYCDSGYSCYNNRCVSCPSGYYLGTDGQCYK